MCKRYAPLFLSTLLHGLDCTSFRFLAVDEGKVSRNTAQNYHTSVGMDYSSVRNA
jgi:hypothetical protein